MIDWHTSTQDDITVLQFSGRVDSMNGAQFGEALIHQLDRGNVKLVIVLEAVVYMSSAGLREIVMAWRKSRTNEGDIRLVAPSERVREVMEMAGIDTFIPIFGTQDEAIASFLKA